MKCSFITKQTKEYNICAIGLYGGKPSHGTCRLCIERGENTAEFAAQLAERSERSHPATAARVSGCCDSAKNYLTAAPSRSVSGAE
jgi:hypothetical protein